MALEAQEAVAPPVILDPRRRGTLLAKGVELVNDIINKAMSQQHFALTQNQRETLAIIVSSERARRRRIEAERDGEADGIDKALDAGRRAYARIADEHTPAGLVAMEAREVMRAAEEESP